MTIDSDASSEIVDPTLTPLKQALQDCKGAIYFMAFLSFVISLVGITPMLYMMNVFDRVIPTNSHITLVSLLTLVVGLYFFWTAIEWLRKRLMIRISLRIDWDMAANIFDACFKKSLMHKDPNVHQVMGDLLTLRQFMTGHSILALIDTPFAIVYLVLAYLIHPVLAAFIMFATAILLAITLFTRKVTTPAIQAANKHNMEANRIAAAGLKNAETALAMGMLPVLRNRWHGRHRNFLQYHVNSSEASGFIGMVGGVFTKLLPTLQITVGVMLAGAGLISVGGVIAAGFIISRAVGPLKELIEKWEEIVRARMAYERLDALLLNQKTAEQKMSLPAPQGALSLQGVRAKAPNSGREILKGLDFELPAGSVLAIVGPNAAGKSTLLKLILGLWKPSDGFVRLDGAEIYDWNHEELGPFIGYVAQKPELFEATVAENIARLSDVDADKVVAAAQLAGIHDIVLGFPEGYDTILCSGEFELSGGQAQRISIARALYNNPKLVVLDEPNAALDDAAEQQLVVSVQALREKGTTVVFTSHRPRLISISDNLLILKDGQQVAFGKTAEMLKKSSPVKLDGVAMDSEIFVSSRYSKSNVSEIKKQVSVAASPAVIPTDIPEVTPVLTSADTSPTETPPTENIDTHQPPVKTQRKSLLFTEVKA